jgi:hypothetical protein
MRRGSAQQPQQTGMPFIIRQQVQPAFIMAEQHSQHAWIMAAHALSPLVQVTVHPSAVVSHLHMPITRLQQQAIIPFIIMQHEHIPPAIMVQRFCIMVRDTSSSHLQVIFMPPGHFSIVMVHRGTIIMFAPAGIIDGPPAMPAPVPMPGMPDIPIAERSIIIMVVIVILPPHVTWAGPEPAGSRSRAEPSGPRRTAIILPRRRSSISVGWNTF